MRSAAFSLCGITECRTEADDRNLHYSQSFSDESILAINHSHKMIPWCIFVVVVVSFFGPKHDYIN